MAKKQCTWFDWIFKWIGIIALVVAIVKYGLLKYLNQHYQLLSIDLAHQLGI